MVFDFVDVVKTEYHSFLDPDHQRTAIVHDKIITGCWMCRYRIRRHEAWHPVEDRCERRDTKLSNIHIVPKECNYLVSAE